MNPYDLLLTESNGKIAGFIYHQKYSDAPPTRLLSLTLILCYWLGFHDADEGHHLHQKKKGGIEACIRIKKAYDRGFADNPKKPNAKRARTSCMRPVSRHDS